LASFNTELVTLLDYITAKYDKLLAQDRTEYSKFIYHKNHIIDRVAEVIKQLSTRPLTVRVAGRAFIQSSYNLHQYVMQLVIDQVTPSQQKISDLHKGLTLVHHHAKELMASMNS